MVPAQTLVARGVLEIERARPRVREARERRVRAEERRDEDVREATVGRARRVRVERATRDPTAQEAVEPALLAGIDRRPVVRVRLAGAGALALVGQEPAAVAAKQRVAAVVIPRDPVRAL